MSTLTPMAALMLVANPAASQFTGGDHRAILSLLSRRHRVEAVWPSSAADARVIAADAVTAGFDGVIAMGGDGIVHQVAQALVGSEVFLAVIPAGTTNVFARQIGLPSKPVRAARLLAGDPQVRRLPVLTVEATRPDHSTSVRHAVFAVGVGMDADVVAAAETEPYRKYRFGEIHYLRTSLSLLWSDVRHRRPTITVAARDRSTTAVAVMAQFHPAFTYFGSRPLRFAPGIPHPMSLLVVDRLPMRHLPALLWHLATRRSLAEVTGIDVWQSIDSFKVSAPAGGSRYELDGEVMGKLVSAVVTFRPDALWVVGPRPTGASPK